MDKGSGQVDVALNTKTARQSIPDTNRDVGGYENRGTFTVGGDPSQQYLAGGVPDPGCGEKGMTMDLGAVAPIKTPLLGHDTPKKTRFALGRVPD